MTYPMVPRPTSERAAALRVLPLELIARKRDPT